MVGKLVTVTLVLAVALGSWFAYYFSDKEVVKRQLTELAAELGKEGNETPLENAFAMRAVKKQLAGKCQVIIPEQEYDQVLERDLIISYLMYHRNRYETLVVTFAAMDINIPVKGKAEVHGTVRLNTTKTGQAAAEELGQVSLALIRGEDDWLLHRVVLSENLVAQAQKVMR